MGASACAERRPVLTSGPPRLRAGRPGRRVAFRRGDRAPRPPLHDAGAVARPGRRDHPRLHLLRPSRVAPALEGRVLPACHPARRPSGRRAHLRQWGHGRAPGRERHGARTGDRGSARRRPRPLLAVRAECGSGWRCVARTRRAARPAPRGVRRHPRTSQGGGPAGRRVRRAGGVPPRRGARAGGPGPAGAWPRPSRRWLRRGTPTGSSAPATCPTPPCRPCSANRLSSRTRRWKKASACPLSRRSPVGHPWSRRRERQWPSWPVRPPCSCRPAR